VNRLLDSGALIMDIPGLIDREWLRCKVKGIGCGDQAFIHAVLALGGCNSSHPCAYCEVAKLDMYDASSKEPRMRTTKRIKLLAHAMVGTCPGCRQVLTADDVAQPGYHTQYATRNTQHATRNIHIHTYTIHIHTYTQ
jgi:hypothetical protein